MKNNQLTGIRVYLIGDSWAYEIRVGYHLQEQTPENFGFVTHDAAFEAAKKAFFQWTPPPPQEHWEIQLEKLKKQLGIIEPNEEKGGEG